MCIRSFKCNYCSHDFIFKISFGRSVQVLIVRRAAVGVYSVSIFHDSPIDQYRDYNTTLSDDGL